MLINKTGDLSLVPNRIISLVPSQTELLHYLRLDEKVIGITKFCVHPHTWFTTKEKIGGTKTINIEKIKKLQPDLIIGNKEENVKEQIEELSKDFAVFVTDVNNLTDACAMIKDIGKLTGLLQQAEDLVLTIQKEFAIIAQPTNLINTAYLIWQKPYMAAGGNTFINDMLTYCGCKNIFAGKERYPSVSIEDIKTAECKLLLLSSEPFPFKQKHIDELQLQLPDCKILLADGEMFSWYGSRLLNAAKYFLRLRQSFV
jgi:ABC-type Fe3+-hydroxamate transport system substrate-binding protein